jgi:cell division protein FtsI/penicillin-binding protein 2
MTILAQRLGNPKIHVMLREFGFGETTGIEVPDEEPGIMLPLDRWTRDSIPSVSMGQEIAVTPIQLGAAFSAICNGGKLVRPRVLPAVQRDQAGGQEPRQVLAPEVARDMVEMLTRVCTEGTGKGCKLDHWQALGKTGTAQLPSKDGKSPGYETDAYLASFIGAAPASKPQVVALVMTRHPRTNGQSGGQVSVPAVKEVLNYTLGYLNVPHDLPKQTRPGD